MKEALQPIIEANKSRVQLLPLQNIEEEGYELRDGYSGHSYRGNHRSHNRGVGHFAFRRSLWQLRYRKCRKR